MHFLRYFPICTLWALLTVSFLQATPTAPDRSDLVQALNDRDDHHTRFNLAVFERLEGNPAAALAHARIAARHAPWNSEIRELRNELLRELRQPPPHSIGEGFVRVSWSLPSTLLLWAAVGLFWIAVTVTTVTRAIRQPFPTGAVGILLAATLVFALLLYGQHWQGKYGTIVATESIPLRSTPASAAPEVGWLIPGESARLLTTRGDYVQVRNRRNETGWVLEEYWVQ